MTQTILPPLAHSASEAPEPEALHINADDLPPELQFEPIPTRKQWKGLTAQKQRQFIAHLAACGSVEMAAKAIGVSANSLYMRRRKPAAASFAAAWDRAVDMGARRVLDTLMEHAIHGTPERLVQGGEVVLERRRYHTRATQWIVQQRFPEEYGGNLNVLAAPRSAMPHSLKKLKEEWRKEWEAEQRAESEARSGNAIEEVIEKLRNHRRHFKDRIKPYPEMRAAWELLCGPTDWEDLDQVPSYGWDNLPDTNFNRPDMVVTLAREGEE